MDAFAEHKKEVFLLLLLLVFSFLLRMAFIHQPFERDEGVYAYVGQEILRGGLPYRDVLDIKPPGIHYIYALAIELFGATTESIRLFTAFYSLLTTVAVYLVARKLAGPRAGLFAAFLYGIYGSDPRVQGNSSNSEVFMVLPLVVSSYFFLLSNGKRQRIHLFLSGLCGGLALLIKTVAAPQVALLLLLAIFPRDRTVKLKEMLGDALIFVLPMFLLAGGTTAFFAFHGVLHDFLYWNLIFPRQYINSCISGPSIWLVIPHLLPVFLPIFVLGLPTAMWLAIRKHDRYHLLVLLNIPAAYLGVLLPGKFFLHYFIQLVPPLAVAAGIALNEITLARGREFIAGMALMAGVLFYTAYNDYRYYLLYGFGNVSEMSKEGSFRSKHLADYIKSRTHPTDYIFQWGMTSELYFLSDRRSPNRFTSNLLIKWSPDPSQAIREMTVSLITKKPVYVYVDRIWMNSLGNEELLRIVERDYLLELHDEDGSLYRCKITGTL